MSNRVTDGSGGWCLFSIPSEKSEVANRQQAGTYDGCNFTSAAGWRECVGLNVGRQTALLTARAPHLLISAGLMEFLYRFNLDDPSAFEGCCRPGTVGRWGSGNDGCVPDVATACVQNCVSHATLLFTAPWLAN